MLASTREVRKGLPLSFWYTDHMTLQPGDIFLTRGTSWFSGAIRFFTRRIGEERTKVNHVGVVVEGGHVERVRVVEALSTVKKRNITAYRGKKTAVAVYRPTNLTSEQLQTIVDKSNSYVGRQYGWFKIVMHLIDWVFQGAYVARRLTNSDNYPICSWLVAQAYAEVGADFGVEPGAASPDDIWDFVTQNTDKYEMVHPLLPLQ